MSEDIIDICTLSHFTTLRAPELQQFILARYLTPKRKCDSTGLMKPRSALVDAVQCGGNLISVAFDVRGNKSRLVAAVEGRN